jgi:hypothetical protein
MAVIISLPLFGPLGHELDEGSAVKGRQLRDLGTDLQDRLQQAAETLDRLAAEGWSARVALYDVLLSRQGVETRDEAVRQLTALGINPEDLVIVEEIEEEDLGHA